MRRLDSNLKDEIGRLVRAQFSNVGYIRPGHGWKGKQELIDSNDDLQEMYSVYGNKKDILLWCHLISNGSGSEKSRKRLAK